MRSIGVYRALAVLLAAGSAVQVSFAKLPSELPGEEITEQQYFDFAVPRDSITKLVPPTSPSSPTWLDSAARTWDAPGLATQMAEDEEKLQMGMGAIFVPRMSDGELEPDVEVLDQAGEVVARGQPGRKYSVVPGTYYVMLGSGSHKQRIVKKVEATEGIVVPLVPDWAAVSINVVDANNVPFRGEYELVRIDDFEPFGRGYGPDPDLGEELQTWILRPGIYKIFGVGQGYNTLTNFVTVRLLPGEYVRFLLVEEETDLKILGGGNVGSGTEKSLFTNWRYGIDVGGSVDFNALRDRLDSAKTKTEISLSLLSRFLLKYDKDPLEWDSRLQLDEGVSYARKEERLDSRTDEVELRSIFTWRVLKWFGPYGRFEMETEVVPEYERAPGTVDRHYFVVLKSDSTIAGIDSLRTSYLLQPAFSPLVAEAGVGANMRLVHVRFLDMRLLAGIGFTRESRFREADQPDTVVRGSPPTSLDLLYEEIDSLNKSISIIRPLESTTTRPEYGPEIAQYTTLRIGRWATTESEFRLFAPVERMRSIDFKPDIRWRATLSWRLIRSITLDYQAEYTLRWPKATTLRSDEWRHRILIRFSYTSR